MKISRKAWLGFILLASISCAIWYIFSYSQFAILNFSVSKKEALKSADKYLSASLNINTSEYLKAVVLKGDFWADIYLQRTLGFRKQEEFAKEQGYEFLYWAVRFFKENQKEEYRVSISPSTGDVIGFAHLIEDTEERKTPDEESAKIKAIGFLQKLYGLDFQDYVLHEKRLIKFDKRTDYEFSWEKKGLYIPWKEKPDSGGAKLLIKATVSGDEVREFYKARFDIPEKFNRFVEKNIYFGESLSSLSFLVFVFWIAIAVVILFRRKEDPSVRCSFRFYLIIGLSLFFFNIFERLNDSNSILFMYPTSSTLSSFLGLYFVSAITGIIFMCLTFLLPAISGEYLTCEVWHNKRISFYYYIRTTFFSRNVAKLIILGYLLCSILLGTQSLALYFGNKHLGLWVEKIRLVQVSTGIIPFYGAFFIGLQAAFSEELVFRLFGINWLKRYFKSTVVAILLTSLIWGFGHTNYPVFPVWFRGIEVTCLGIIYGVMYLRFGLIPLLVAHYLFDVYWGIAPYIFGGSTIYLFSGSVFIVFIPLIFGFICYILNQKEEEKRPEAVLSSRQMYNSQILTAYIEKRLAEGLTLQSLEDELLKNGWDATLVWYVLEKRDGLNR